MKLRNSLLALILIAAMLFASVTSCFAAPSVADLQKSVVYVESTISFTIPTIEASLTVPYTFKLSGTGFAVGKIGQKVEYIATAAHLAPDIANGGAFAVTFTALGEFVGVEACETGATYGISVDEKTGNITYSGVVAGLTSTTKAYFSNESWNYVDLEIVARDDAADIALLKIVSGPTDKIKARPIQGHKDNAYGTRVYAIGYSSLLNYYDTSKFIDNLSSTAVSGTISQTIITHSKRVNTDKVYYAYVIDASTTIITSGGPLFTENGTIVGMNDFGMEFYNTTFTTNAVCLDSLVNMLDNYNISYSKTYFDNLWVYIICAVLLVGAIVVLIIVLSKKKKSQPAEKPEEKKPEESKKAEKTYYLKGITGYFAGKKFKITDVAVIGRDSTRCNVVFPTNQPGISGMHCELTINNGLIVLKDLGSSYGTFKGNGEKLDANVPNVLKSGECFWLADKKSTFEVEY